MVDSHNNPKELEIDPKSLIRTRSWLV